MTGKSKYNDIHSDFEETFVSYSDDELIDVLKKRKHYQKEAANKAIEEAIKRGIIHSEQDLYAEEYVVEPLKFSLIPKIENETARNKIRKSLARSLMIVGVLPLVWGGLKILQDKFLEGILLVGMGVLWTLVSFQIFKNNFRWMVLLFLLLGAAIIYVSKFFISRKFIDFMDIFITAIVLGLVLYGLLFVQKLKK